MTRSPMVEEILVVMEKQLEPSLAELAVEDRLRLDGLVRLRRHGSTRGMSNRRRY